MQKTTRRLGLGLGLSLASLALTGCGDPCLDDGLGKGKCNSQTGGDDVGTTDTDTDTDTGETATETGTDQDTGMGESYCVDEDMDGFGDPDNCTEVPEGEEPPPGSVPETNGADCDDADPNTFPGAAELDDPEACMTDADMDGYGDDMPSSPDAVPGSDCDDDAAATFPGSAELDDPNACMADIDGDGYGDSSPDDGNTVPGTDCDDTNPAVFGCTLWCEDADGDGVGGQNCVPVPLGEDPPPGYVEGDNDCLDDNPDVYPGAAEQEPDLCTADIDNDGYGDDNASMTYPGAEDGTDCLDTNPDAFPGSAELDDPDACMLDADGDGWGEAETPNGVVPGRDCNDSNPDAVVCADAIPGCVDLSLGGNSQLMSSAVGGDGNYTFSWEPPETLSDANVSDPIATPTEITTYTVTATDGQGNMGSDELTVHITDKPWVLGGMDAECTAVGFLGAPAAHDFANMGTTTCTIENTDPTAYICPVVHQQARITGFMTVGTADDDDFIGFVWGWQNMNQFYLLSWKQAAQAGFGNCNSPAGITVKLMDAQGAFTPDDFACPSNTPNSALLMAPAQTTTAGWIDNRVYAVELLYDLTQTEITITDTQTMNVVANFIVADGTYPSGQFGTYDYSQVSACNGPWNSSCL